MDPFYFDIDDDTLKKERAKARALRNSAWWKRRRGTGLCHYCGKKFHPTELTMDHLIPLSRGGRNNKGNVVPACKACNNRKKYLLPIEWEAYLSSFDKTETEG
ncbi:MAG: HNH endonuclease [Nitrospiria bacterium]